MEKKMAEQLDRIEAGQSDLNEKMIALDSKFQIHIAQHVASDKCQDDHETILRGSDKLGGLVVEANYVKMRQNIVFAILGALGVGFIGLLINVIVSFIQ
jgi:hypothetical protein